MKTKNLLLKSMTLLALTSTAFAQVSDLKTPSKLQDAIKNAELKKLTMAGSGNGNGTDDVIQVTYKSDCGNSGCNAPDLLKPYRDIFNQAKPADLKSLGDGRQTYINFDDPMDVTHPVDSVELDIDFTHLVPMVAVGSAPVKAWDTELKAKCAKNRTHRDCRLNGSMPKFALPVISEDGELRQYVEYYDRLTFRISGEYAIIKEEVCLISTKSWTEASYYLINLKRDLLKQ